MYDKLRYPSQRPPLCAQNIVVTSQPLAAQAGIDALKSGGNAVDAAIATAITLTVVEPTGNGLGSDAFALLWNGSSLVGINGSGRSPALWERSYFEKYEIMPQFGWDSVTVPGAVAVWIELSERYGRLRFSELFKSAINYAENGFHVGIRTAYDWNHGPEKWYREFENFRREFLPPPKFGQLIKRRDLANTLREIADTKRQSFYEGRLASLIEKEAKKDRGLLRSTDLATHKSEWVKPISQKFRKSYVFEIPPNGQGIAALIAFAILDKFPIFPIDSEDSVHLQIESMKIGLYLANKYVADERSMKVSASDLLQPEFVERHSNLIDLNEALQVSDLEASNADTVYLSAADDAGLMVSFIQSNYFGFGSGIVIPDTGIALQNRGSCFTLQSGHVNEVGPRKRPFHTIIPSFVFKNNEPFLCFGVMGGSMQAQGHLQIVERILTYELNPQAASDAPRWQLLGDSSVAVEPGFSYKLADGLARRGHNIVKKTDCFSFGGAQIIQKIDDGYMAGSDHRKEGYPIGY